MDELVAWHPDKTILCTFPDTTENRMMLVEHFEGYFNDNNFQIKQPRP